MDLLILVYVQLFCQDTCKRRAVYFVICNINGTRLTLLILDIFLGGWWSQFLCHAPAGMWWHPYCSCCKWKWLYLDKLFQHTPIIKNISYQESLFTDFNMHVFHSPIHISMLLSSEKKSYVMKQLFFDIKVLCTGLESWRLLYLHF